MAKVLRTECGINRTCPEIKVEGGVVKITGYREGAAHIPENEVTVEAPPRLFPELARLDIDDFEAWLGDRLHSPGDMLRVQTLQRYGNEDHLVHAYHRGEPAPLADFAAWGNILDAHHLAGQTYRNLHVVNGRLSLEMQMQFGWAYTFNTEHHMHIRVLDVAEQPAAAALLRLGDFWVVERDHVALCRYDEDAQPQSPVEVEPAGATAYREIAEMGWELGVDFEAWWGVHARHYSPARRWVA